VWTGGGGRREKQKGGTVCRGGYFVGLILESSKVNDSLSPCSTAEYIVLQNADLKPIVLILYEFSHM
jgi:hypothetical protein